MAYLKGNFVTFAEEHGSVGGFDQNKMIVLERRPVPIIA